MSKRTAIPRMMSLGARHVRRLLGALALGTLTVLAAFSSARADLPSPRLDLLFPVGGAAGSTADLIVVGNDLDGCEQLLCTHPGVQAAFVKEAAANRREFKLTIGPDVPPGTYDVYAAGRFGITNPRLLHVSRGLVEVPEVEPNNTPQTAQTVGVNVAINQHADGNNQDYFKVPLKAGQRVTIDCLSARLETEMDAVLFVFAADGRQLAANSDYIGRDPLIDFLAPADGEYVVEVRDLTYRQGFPYRLLIHDRPRVENVFPRAVQAGQTAALTAFGANLGDGAQPTDLKIGDVPLQQKAFTYAAPPELLALGLFRFREHPLQHSVLPTAATCTLVGEQILPFDADPAVLVVGETAPSVEQEPNDSKDQPQALALPALVSARFDKPRDADWYVFETDAMGGAYGFDVYAERIAGRCDPYLSLYDEQGNRFFDLDDFGHRMNAFDGHLRDPAGQTNLPGGKKIRVLVQDRYQRGGPRYQYVLNIRKAKSDFFAASIHSNPNVAGTTVWQGGAAYLDVVLHHVDGGNQYPTTITAEGLPPGLHVTPTTITNDTRGSLVFWSDDSAPAWTGAVKLWATSKHGDRELRREVRPHTRAYQLVGSRPMRDEYLAIRERAPYALRIEPERISVEAGQKAEVKLVVTRYWPDFQNAVNFQPLNWPGFLQLGNGTIAAGQTELPISIQVQGGAPPGDFTIAVLGQAQVPFNKDPNAKEKPNTLVPTPSRPLTLTVVKPPQK